MISETNISSINQTIPPNRKEVALILKGGGVKGLALAGAIIELEKYFHFNAYVGTSAGAIVAGLLGIGAAPADILKILRETNFASFADNGKRLWWLWNFVFHRYLHTGKVFEEWISKQIEQIYLTPRMPYQEPNMNQLEGSRISIYASQENMGVVCFDTDPTKGDSNEKLSFAVRASMSIPGYFKAPIYKGLPIFDGGIKANFPARYWLQDNPNSPFVGIYLGNKLAPKGSRTTGFSLTALVNLIVNDSDVAFIDNNRAAVLVVDPSPIETTDFDLSKEEAEFLVLKGKADALTHLRFFLPARTKPSQAEVDAANLAAENALKIVIPIRKRRNKIKWLKRISAALILLSLLFSLVWFGVIPVINYFSMENLYREAEKNSRGKNKESLVKAIEQYQRLIDSKYKIVSAFDNQGHAYEELAKLSECNVNLDYAIQSYTGGIVNIQNGVKVDDEQSSLGSIYLNRAYANQKAGHFRQSVSDARNVCENVNNAREKCDEAKELLTELEVQLNREESDGLPNCQ